MRVMMLSFICLICRKISCRVISGWIDCRLLLCIMMMGSIKCIKEYKILDKLKILWSLLLAKIRINNRINNKVNDVDKCYYLILTYRINTNEISILFQDNDAPYLFDPTYNKYHPKMFPEGNQHISPLQEANIQADIHNSSHSISNMDPGIYPWNTLLNI